MNEYERHQELQYVYTELCRADISEARRLELTVRHRELIADLPRDDWTEREMRLSEDSNMKNRMSEAQLDAMHKSMFPDMYPDANPSPYAARREGVKLDELSDDDLAAIDSMYAAEMASAEAGDPKILLSDDERALAAERLRQREGRAWRRQRDEANRALAEQPRRELLALKQEAEDAGRRLRRVAERDERLRGMTTAERDRLQRAGAFDDLDALDRALGLAALPPTDEQVLDELHAQLMGGSTAREDGRVEMTERPSNADRLNL